MGVRGGPLQAVGSVVELSISLISNLPAPRLTRPRRGLILNGGRRMD
jgi:hypothetical protein